MFRRPNPRMRAAAAIAGLGLLAAAGCKKDAEGFTASKEGAETLVTPAPAGSTVTRRCMNALRSAVINRDRDRMLELISPTLGWTTEATLESPFSSHALSYQETADGLLPGGEFRDWIFGGNESESLWDHLNSDESWVEHPRIPMLWVPGHLADQAHPRIFVRWRTGEGCLVDSVGLPFG